MRAEEKQSGGLFFADVCVPRHSNAAGEPLRHCQTHIQKYYDRGAKPLRAGSRKL